MTTPTMPADSRDMVLVPRLVLEPFARAAGKLDGKWDDRDCRWNDPTRSGVTVAHIRAVAAALSASPARGEGDAPVGVTIFCPACSVPHVDEGEWATTRHHKTHQCQSCGHEWRPFPFATVGVAHPVSPSPGEGDAPVAWRYRYYTSDGRKKPWIVRQSPIEPSAPGPKWCGTEVEPLFTRPTPATPEGLREALGRAVVFDAYSAADPLALRFEFQTEEDRLAAANAVDAALQPQAEGE